MPKTTVAELLAEANQAHREYRDLRPRMANVGGLVQAVPGDEAAAIEALERALVARAKAERLDVAGDDAAWMHEPLHYALLKFYADERRRQH